MLVPTRFTSVGVRTGSGGASAIVGASCSHGSHRAIASASRSASAASSGSFSPGGASQQRSLNIYLETRRYLLPRVVWLFLERNPQQRDVERPDVLALGASSRVGGGGPTHRIGVERGHADRQRAGVRFVGELRAAMKKDAA